MAEGDRVYIDPRRETHGQVEVRVERRAFRPAAFVLRNRDVCLAFERQPIEHRFDNEVSQQTLGIALRHSMKWDDVVSFIASY